MYPCQCGLKKGACCLKESMYIFQSAKLYRRLFKETGPPRNTLLIPCTYTDLQGFLMLKVSAVIWKLFCQCTNGDERAFQIYTLLLLYTCTDPQGFQRQLKAINMFFSVVAALNEIHSYPLGKFWDCQTVFPPIHYGCVHIYSFFDSLTLLGGQLTAHIYHGTWNDQNGMCTSSAWLVDQKQSAFRISQHPPYFPWSTALVSMSVAISYEDVTMKCSLSNFHLSWITKVKNCQVMCICCSSCQD